MVIMPIYKWLLVIKRLYSKIHCRIEVVGVFFRPGEEVGAAGVGIGSGGAHGGEIHYLGVASLLFGSW